MSRELPRQIEVPVDRQERQLPRDLKPPYLTRQTLELVTALKAAEGGAVGEFGEWRVHHIAQCVHRLAQVPPPPSLGRRRHHRVLRLPGEGGNYSSRL